VIRRDTDGHVRISLHEPQRDFRPISGCERPPQTIEQAHEKRLQEISHAETIAEKYAYICVAFDGDNPQIEATENHLIERSERKNHKLAFLKGAGGCSMTQSPNDINRGMHPVLKNIYQS
jgi:hypothetical protein